MKLFGISLVMALFAISTLEAALCVEMDSKNLLKCTLSSRHHNRIAVEGQRIKKIFYPEGDILIRMEEESGQIFVQALVEQPSETTVSIITSEGLVQDIELNFADKSSEILILKDRLSIKESRLEGSFICCDDEFGVMQHAIETLMSGNIPEEYVPVADRQICCQIKGKVILTSVMRLVGPLYTIYVLWIENKGPRPVCMHEHEINCINGEWIFLERNQLKRDEKMMALIGVKTYEQ